MMNEQIEVRFVTAGEEAVRAGMHVIAGWRRAGRDLGAEVVSRA
jgi:hypothetical protein